MNQTINVSLPSELKNQTEELIKAGAFASFSDAVRTGLRSVIRNAQYEVWSAEAKLDRSLGRGTVMKSEKDIENYIEKIFNEANAV